MTTNTNDRPAHKGYPGTVLTAPTVTPDRVTTIAIGDLDANGARIDAAVFDQATDYIAREVQHLGGTVYAVAHGNGITSDQPTETTERTAIILCGNVSDLPALRATVAAVLRAMGGTSACFSTDGTHEPAFAATLSGHRPI